MGCGCGLLVILFFINPYLTTIVAFVWLVFTHATMPSIEGKTVVLVDPMLATGSSIILAYNKICTNGEPLHTHIVAAIASRESLSLLSKNLPHSKVTLWVGAVDEELTNKSYIVPGLGDAGDL